MKVLNSWLKIQVLEKDDKRYGKKGLEIAKGWGFPGGSLLKNLPANAGNTGYAGRIPWTSPLEGKMATHSSIFAWEIHGQEKTGELQSTRLQKSQTQLSD